VGFAYLRLGLRPRVALSFALYVHDTTALRSAYWLSTARSLRRDQVQ